MNEFQNISPSSAFDAASLSILRRIPRGTPASNGDGRVYLPAIDDIVAWAGRASGKGRGDAKAAFPPNGWRRTARTLHRKARSRRPQAIAAFIATSLASVFAALQRVLVSYRTYRDVRETMSALRGLDDRTLHDLGYHRSEIESVAIEVHIAHAR